MPLLKPGARAQLVKTAREVEVRTYLAEGGQGEVWEAVVDGEGAFALKWYKLRSATRDQRFAIETLVDAGPPNERFLWPLDIAENEDSFGYVMNLRPARYRGLSDLLRGRVQPRAKELVGAAIQLAESFYELHARGLCYRDISFGNAFFDFDSGEILICDNDNVGVDGVANTSILGTAGFMAPEVLRGDASPSSLSDLHSLAVVLFYMLMLHHPLLGQREHAWACLDDEAWMELTGWNPLFVFDPIDHGNAPVPGAHDNVLLNWPAYPGFVRELFSRAFTVGLHDPGRRVRETEWRRGLTRLRDLAFICDLCDQENYFDAEVGPRPCPGCGATVSPAAVLVLNGTTNVVLGGGTKLFAHHLESRPYDFTRPLAEVTRHPADGRWGLKNLSPHPWSVTSSSGVTVEVLGGRSVALQEGMTVQFGLVVGELRGLTATPPIKH